MPDATAGAPGAAADAKAWRVAVDRGACLGSGICAALAPESFRLEDERSRPLREAAGPDEALLDAADSCPAAAITVTRGTEVIGPRP
ncbi:ferredoxin [Streptomyces roseoverticillatus]|uniref:ferredoxin n=1 Tax=Streptomyces roseoverticillatus TaxID=66429 RepID=UPI001F198C40|nr:ferredoxin [Streptomyces roseoverticillatus]